MENKIEKGTKLPTANRGIIVAYTNLPEFIKEIEQEIFINKKFN